MKFAAAVSAARLLVGFGSSASAQPAMPQAMTERVSNAMWDFQQKNYQTAFAQFNAIAVETDNANAETMLGINVLARQTRYRTANGPGT